MVSPSLIIKAKSSISSKSRKRIGADAHVPFPLNVAEGTQEDRPQFPRVSQQFPGLTVASAEQKMKLRCLSSGKVNADLLSYRRQSVSTTSDLNGSRPLLSELDRRLFKSRFQWCVSHGHTLYASSQGVLYISQQ